jgi:hypothetical protein
MPIRSLIACLLAVTACAAYALWRPAPRPAPGGIPELVHLLEQNGPRLYRVSSMARHEMPKNVYLTTSPRTFDEVNALYKSPEAQDAWRGVVYCEVTSAAVQQDMLDQWGPLGMAAGPYVFFGDPELLRAIRATLPAEMTSR